MPPAIPHSKLEPIQASDFADLPANARHVLMQRAAKSAPGFAFELSKALPTRLIFEQAYDSSIYKDKGCPFEHAISSGHFALARLWAARARSSPDAKRTLPNPERPTPFSLALDSSQTDERIWLSRRWLSDPLSKPHAAIAHRHANPNASDLVQLCIQSFSSGRPGLGLLFARELASRPPEEIAQATINAHDWPDAIEPSLWTKSKEKRHAFMRDIESRCSDRSSFSNAPIHPRRLGVLSHLDYWAAATLETDPKLSSSLDDCSQALWQAGAFASPQAHARLFFKKPYGPNDPRAQLCQAAALALPDLKPPGRYGQEDPRAPLLGIFFATLAKACAEPGNGISLDARHWDAFTHAYSGAPQGNPNPFSTWGPSSCALLSLCGNGRLIEIGLARGFSPEASQWFLASPGSVARAFRDERLDAPKIDVHPISGTSSFYPHGFGIHRPRHEAGKRKPTAPKDCATPAGLPKHDHDDTAKHWRYQSLASIALACGFRTSARALARAGSPAASLALLSEEAPKQFAGTLSKIAALADADALADTVIDHGQLPTGPKPLRV